MAAHEFLIKGLSQDVGWVDFVIKSLRLSIVKTDHSDDTTCQIYLNRPWQ
jgi:hypothetical protein